MQDIRAPRTLPIVRIDGRRYYADERLREYRAVDNPHDRLPMPYEFHIDTEEPTGA